MPLVAYDGDRIWDPVTKVLTFQMTSDDAIKQAQAMIRDDGTTMHINFVRVQYTAKELNDLANHLLRNQLQWAGATGIGGGYDASLNRVLLQLDPEYKDTPTLIDAIEKLNDPRISLQFIESMEGWKPETRVDDFAPWTAGAAIDAAAGGCTLGWTWKLWGTNQIVGSTARHCADLYWYNNGTYVGTVFQSSQSTDSAL